MSARRASAYALTGALAVASAGSVLAQGAQPGQQQAVPRGGQTGAAVPGTRELSPASQNALARLHALNMARASFAKVGAEMAQDEDAKSFLRERAQDYEQADTRLSAFAQTYGVDLRSEAMQKKTKQTLAQWDKENEKLRKAKPDQVAKLALGTFIQRNDEAVSDLRQIRGDVQEDELRQLINQRIAAIEEESTRAQELRQRIMEQQQQREQQGGKSK